MVRKVLVGIIIIVFLIAGGLFFLAYFIGIGCGFKKVCSDFATYSIAIKMYEVEKGGLPEELPLLLGSEGDKYLEALPLDPWGNTYDYFTSKGDKLKYVIVTYGADGKVGGRDENRDIYSSDEYCQ